MRKSWVVWSDGKAQSEKRPPADLMDSITRCHHQICKECQPCHAHDLPHPSWPKFLAKLGSSFQGPHKGPGIEMLSILPTAIGNGQIREGLDWKLEPWSRDLIRLSPKLWLGLDKNLYTGGSCRPRTGMLSLVYFSVDGLTCFPCWKM